MRDLEDDPRSYFPYLRMLFEACGRLPSKEVTLWRGVGVDLYDQYKVGSTITWWGVSSCTSDKPLDPFNSQVSPGKGSSRTICK